MNKEVNDALHALLSMALENEKYTTQKEQYNIVHKEIERLQDKILKLETDASIYKDLSDLRQEKLELYKIVIKEVREEIRILETNCDIADYQAQKLFNILDKEEENTNGKD